MHQSTPFHHEIVSPLSEEDPGREGIERTPQRPVRFSFLRLPGGSADNETPSRINVTASAANYNLSPTSIQQTSTADTADTEDSPTSSANYGHNGQSLKIEHTINVATKGGGGGGGTARKLSKPVIALIGGIVLLTTGSAAYFFREFLTIPGLKTQVDRLEDQVLQLQLKIDELEAQVDRLGGEVDRLGTEVNRLANETDRLENANHDLAQNIDNYAFENDRLNATIELLDGMNGQLNNTAIDLTVEINLLKRLNESLFGINKELNLTVADLSNQVDDLEVVNDELTKTTNTLWTSIGRLSNETATLSMMNEELNFAVTDLRNEVTNLTGEVDRLNRITANLATLVPFLNETASSIDQSLDNVTDFLAKQIDTNRMLVMETLENLYRQRTSSWDCDFREFFLTEPFVSNRTASIGTESYQDVIDYIDDRILSDLCLDNADFEAFLGNFVNAAQLSDASFYQLQQAVGEYTDLAIQYYFTPGFASNSITLSEWAEANYDCKNLPPTASFQFSNVPVLQ
jgi:uncharacterized coiled-coil DUF342 family protein